MREYITPLNVLRLAFPIVLGVFVIYMIVGAMGVRLTPCDNDAEILVPTSNWEITNLFLPAEILWQMAEPVDHPVARTGFAGNGITIMGGNVLYRQRWITTLCDDSPIIGAFDLESGQEQWRFQLSGHVTQPVIFSFDDNAVLIDIDTLLMLNRDGQIVWQHRARDLSFSTRFLWVMYRDADRLYFPVMSLPTTYVVSPQIGERLNTIENVIIHAVFGEYALVSSGNNQLYLVSLDRPTQVIYTITLDEELFRNGRINQIYPYAQRRGNALLLFFESTLVQVYDFETGELLWELNHPMYGIPALLDNEMVVLTLTDRLDVYDIASGDSLGSVQLQRTQDGQRVELADSRFGVWLTGYENTVVIRSIDALELLAIRLDLPEVSRE